MAKPPTRKKNSVKRLVRKPKKIAPAEPVVVEDEDDKPAEKLPRYSSFRLEPSIKRTASPKLPSVFKLSQQAVTTLWNGRKVIGGILLIIGALELVLAGGFAAGSNFDRLRETLESVTFSDSSTLSGSTTLFVQLLGLPAGGNNPVGAVYQTILLLIGSLAIIWTLRQLYAGHSVRARDGFYWGMYPLVPFVLVFAAVIAQLLPFAFGAAIYSIAVESGLASTGLSQALWSPIFIGLLILSLYMITSSLFALYVATLPDMTPMRALRTARDLVAARRWTVLRKILFMPFALLLIAAIITIPVIMFVAPLAPWVMFALGVLFLPIVHSYMYALYRSML